MDEINLMEEYGNFVDITRDEVFLKIQPAIRLADYYRFFGGDGYRSASTELRLRNKTISKYHLTSFTVSYINGCRVLPPEQNNVRDAIHKMLDFLTKDLGLDKKRLYVNYFGTNTPAKDVEASYKSGKSEKRVEVDYIVKEDIAGKQALLEYGLTEEQLMPNTTRDCFLTTNWDITPAPWGYRNEFHYKMDDGSLLDIATVERLDLKPTIEVRDNKNYVIGLEPMERSFFIDGGGLERMTLAMRGNGTIFDILDFESIEKETGLTRLQVESIRILHRVFTDSDWEGLQSWQRKQKTH